MDIRRLFQPKSTISEQDVAHGLRMMTWEGMVSMGFNSITTSGFLAAFALSLEANNFQIHQVRLKSRYYNDPFYLTN